MTAGQKTAFLDRMAKARAAAGSRRNAAKKKTGAKMVRISGYEVREGSKKHKELLALKRHSADLQRSEQGDGRANKGKIDLATTPHPSSIPCARCGGVYILGRDKCSTCGATGAARRGKKAIKKNGAGKKKSTLKRRNSGEAVDAAADRYKFFHGRDPGTIHDIETPVKTFGVLSGIGKLKRLIINAVDGKHVVELEFGKGVFLAQDNKGKQLFIEGGDQSVVLEDFGIVPERRHLSEVLGALTEVWYHTQKDHLHPEDGGDAIYQHKFGKGKYPKGTGPNAWGSRGDRLPLVIYDVTNKLLHITGGDYEIPAEGIDG